ncbi:MAG TPA: iron-sulfur cluster assembly accessory protein [Cyclobacteriaceae bacterium]
MEVPLQPVTISPRAADEINLIRENKGIPAGYGLRVGIRGGGCGAKLVVGFDRQRDNDLAYTISGITVLVDKHHTLYVIGKHIDFYDGADGRGFFFKEEGAPPDIL